MQSRFNFLKGVARLFFALLLLTSSFTVLAFGSSGWQFGLDLRPLNFDVYPNFLPQVSQIPASLRTVPINPADPGAGTPILIPNGTVELGSFIPVGTAISPEVTYRRLTLRAGGLFSWESVLPKPIARM